MACGLFGKLIAKRDFIAVNTPREVLLGWETWMQSSIAASKHELGPAWLKAYMQAPLWRFWLGRQVCGVEVMGVFMSSMDGVGRHFPLTVFTFAESGQRFAVPADGGDQSWFEKAEDFLLSTLDAGEDYDLVLASLARLRDGPAQAHVTAEKPLLARHGALIKFSPEPLVEAGDVARAALVSAIANERDLPEETVPLPEPLSGDVPGGAIRLDAAVPDQALQVAATGDEPAQDLIGLPDTMSPPPASMDLPKILDASLAKADNDHVEIGASSTGPADFGFAALEAELQQQATGLQSFWWTVGGHEHPAMAMIAEGLPDPQLMSLMLTGKPNHPAN